MIKKILVGAVISMFFYTPIFSQSIISLDLDLSYAQQLTISKNGDVYEMKTLGGDPYVRSNKITQTYNPDTTYIIEFEYLSLTGLDDLRIYFNPFSGTNSASSGALPVAEGWTKYIVNLKRYSETWTNQTRDYLRFDFGKSAGKTISVRNIKLRTITAKEYDEWKNSPDKVLTAKLINYNNQVFGKKIERVVVESDSVSIYGSGSSDFTNCFLSEILMHENAFDKNTFDFSIDLPSSNTFHVKIPRLAKNSKNEEYDRLYSRWIITDKASKHLSHAHWADDIRTISQWYIPDERPISAKGLGGVPNDKQEYRSDLVELGIHNITFNFLLPSLISLNPTSIRHELHGQSYHINSNVVAKLDNMFKFCSDNNITVSMILLIGAGTNGELGAIFKHPDATGGIYTLANVVDEKGIRYLQAAIDFLAQRYSRPDMAYGRMTHWILHNEVDAAPVWTNAGDKSQELYIENYSRAMRTVYYTARKYNPVSKVFISLTHHWYHKHTYTSPELLQSLTEIGNREGDFEWGVAYHPYPENLRDPDPWDDNVGFDISNAEYITPKNLELIDLWARSRENLYKGCKVRSVILSENGISHSNYSREQMDLQAAGLAYYWKKLVRLPSIEAFHYHRWVDHANEGNLKFGLWSNKEGTITDFGKKKPSWTLYKYAATNFEDKAFDFTKKIIGINNWQTIINPITPVINPFTIQFEILRNDVSLADVTVYFNTELRRSDIDGKCKFLNVASSVGETELVIQTDEGAQFKFKILADAHKLVTIDIGEGSKEELMMTAGVYEHEHSVFEPFDYSTWFATNAMQEIDGAGIKFYPNPVSDVLTISLPGIGKTSVSIFDIKGQLVYHALVEGNEHKISLNHQFSSGLFLIRLEDEWNNITTHKIRVGN